MSAQAIQAVFFCPATGTGHTERSKIGPAIGHEVVKVVDIDLVGAIRELDRLGSNLVLGPDHQIEQR